MGPCSIWIRLLRNNWRREFVLSRDFLNAHNRLGADALLYPGRDLGTVAGNKRINVTHQMCLWQSTWYIKKTCMPEETDHLVCMYYQWIKKSVDCECCEMEAPLIPKLPQYLNIVAPADIPFVSAQPPENFIIQVLYFVYHSLPWR